jgi:uncharacterized ferritin-like protein (DUF455 family)
VQRLQELGYAYGDMPAHDLLWEGAAASLLNPCRLVDLLLQPVVGVCSHSSVNRKQCSAGIIPLL